jgi:hypothetical protein
MFHYSQEKYAYGGEIARYGKTYIRSTIVSLDNNKILYLNATLIKIPLRGEWNLPPDYSNLRNAIQLASKLAVSEEKKKYEGK